MNAAAWDAAMVLGAIEAALETSRRCGARVTTLEDLGVGAGTRVATRTTVEALLGAIRALDMLLVNRRAVVIHAVIAEGIEAPLVAREHARAVAVRALGVVVLHARDAQHAIDLTLVAHRIAEDLEAPVVVLHDGGIGGRVLDRVTLPAAPLVEAMLGSAPERLHAGAQTPASGWDERATFALGSALRTFERASGRTLGALAMEVKAAFADALTWAPDYPGIGRIPVLCDGSVDPTDGEPSTA
ncbi:MAG: hypothetical protein ACHREM_32565, partial [Polyangiales bacterium]